jgi:hypothetical protein
MKPPGFEQVFARPSVWWSIFVALCLLLLAPLLLADVPPILDYPNHLARLFILAHAGHDPVLDKIWRPHWAVIPDLAIDVVISPLMLVMTPFAAGKIMLALALLMPVAGAVAYSRAAFGRRLYWPMISGLMAYNIIFVFGFINYLIALGGALMAAALWLRLRERPFIVRSLAGAACATALFFTHLFGVAFFGVLVGSAELAELIARRDRPYGSAVGRAAGLLAVSFAPPAILWLWVAPHNAVAKLGGWSPVSKLFYLAAAFAAYHPLPGFLVAVAFFTVAFFWMASRKCQVAPGLSIAVVVILAAIIVLPFSTGGGAYVDSRLPLMLTLALAAGLCPPPLSARASGGIAALLAAALVVEVAAIGSVWRDHEAVVAEFRASIASVPPASRVLTVTVPFEPSDPYWRSTPPGLTAFGVFRTDTHLPALLAIDQRAFWPLLFSDPSQHPIAVQPPYDTIAGDGEPPDLPSLIAGHSLSRYWPAAYLKDWPSNFDFVLLLAAGDAGDLSSLLPDRLRLLNRSPHFALFAVRKSGDFGSQ